MYETSFIINVYLLEYSYSTQFIIAVQVSIMIFPNDPHSFCLLLSISMQQ